MAAKTSIPGLFGQPKGRSSRDYTKERFWGKNQFNSSFPVSLVAYMHSKALKLAYLRTNGDNEIEHDEIGADVLLGMDPLDENTYYNYEAGFAPYEDFYVGDREKIDLVVADKSNRNMPLVGLEIKLTALPDNSTKNRENSEQGCEIVVRPPTICFLACSICSCYPTGEGRDRLRNLLNSVPQINHWEEADEVSPHYDKIEAAVLAVSNDMQDRQKPLVLQPIWKTEGAKMRLAEDCLDCFVWSDLALLNLCIAQTGTPGMSRFKRTVIWTYRMLFDYSVYGQFDYVRIIKLHSYDYANDKAFAVNGAITNTYLKSRELICPRIKRQEIKYIILGGGQKFLSPERRFDAVLAASPEIFE